jgi:hypothetical protein
MNEQLQQALAEIIVSAMETAEAAKEFVLEELPDVVQQLLAWKMMESLIYFVVGLLFLGCVGTYWAVVLKNWGRWVTAHGNTGDRAFNLAFFGGLASIPFLLAFGHFINLHWLQIMVAPKVYLIEYVAELTK